MRLERPEAQSEDRRGGQRKEVSEDEPVESGKNKEKKANPNGNRSVETDPNGDQIGKNRSTVSGWTEYESDRKPIQPKDDRTRPIGKETNTTQSEVEKIEADDYNEEAKKRHHHEWEGPRRSSGFEGCY